MIAVLFTACPKPEPTKEELLTQTKGWTLYTATSNPAYTNKDGERGENLFTVFFEPCELDDILYFNANKSSILNYGKVKCDWDGDGKDLSLGNWNLIKSDEVLEFHLPYFEDFEGHLALLEAKVVDISATTLQLRIPIVFADEAPSTKGDVKNVVKNTRGIKGAKGDDKFEFFFTYTIK
jgi:hypothetical protein